MTTELIQELIGLAVEKTCDFEGYIDVTYFGITGFICVRIFFDETEDDLRFNIDPKEEDAHSLLQEAIDKIKGL